MYTVLVPCHSSLTVTYFHIYSVVTVLHMHNHYYEQKSSTLWLILWWFSPLASVWSLWSFSTSTLFFPFTVVSLGFTCELLQDKVDLPHNFLCRNKTCPYHWLIVAIDARSQSCSVGEFSVCTLLMWKVRPFHSKGFLLASVSGLSCLWFSIFAYKNQQEAEKAQKQGFSGSFRHITLT